MDMGRKKESRMGNEREEWERLEEGEKKEERKWNKEGEGNEEGDETFPLSGSAISSSQIARTGRTPSQPASQTTHCF